MAKKMKSWWIQYRTCYLGFLSVQNFSQA
jgi:hypothetical protein